MASITPITLGTVAEDDTGDGLRTGGQKINDNFAAINADLITALQPDDVASGDITAHEGALDLSGGTDGQVLTKQADGSSAFETPSAATVTVDQYDIVARVAASSGSATGLAAADFDEEGSPASGDFVDGWTAEGTRVVYDLVNFLTDAFAKLQHNLTATVAPTVDDDETEGYSRGSLWFNDDGVVYACSDPSEGAAVWDPLNDHGELADDDFAAGNRVHFGTTSLDATADNVTYDASALATFVIEVTGTPGTARNLTVANPGATTPSLTKLVVNVSDDDVAFVDAAAATIDTVASNTAQFFDWAANAWTAGAVLPGGSGGITAYSEDVAPVDVADSGTLTAASHSEFYVDGSTLKRRKVRLRTSGALSSAMTVTVEDGLAKDIRGTVAADQTGAVTIERDSTATINGGTSITLAGPGASFVIIPGPTDVYNLEGETTEAVTINALSVTTTLGVTGASTFTGTADFQDDVTLDASASGGGIKNSTTGGALSVALSSTYITSNAALTVPTTAIGDGFFHCLLEIGADTHDIDFNSNTLDISAEGFAAGEIYSVIVKSATAIRIQGPAGTFTEADFA